MAIKEKDFFSIVGPRSPVRSYRSIRRAAGLLGTNLHHTAGPQAPWNDNNFQMRRPCSWALLTYAGGTDTLLPSAERLVWGGPGAWLRRIGGKGAATKQLGAGVRSARGMILFPASHVSGREARNRGSRAGRPEAGRYRRVRLMRKRLQVGNAGTWAACASSSRHRA